MELILDILLDTFEDVLKIIPFLFIIYLILEWMEQEAGHKMERFLEKHRRLNPLAGTILDCCLLVDLLEQLLPYMQQV